MGFWDVGPYENDDGSDIKEVWDDYVNDDWSSEKILEFFRRVYFNGNFPNVTDGNSNVYIALSETLSDKGFDLPDILKEKLQLSISRELENDLLEEWGENRRRRVYALKKLVKKHSLDVTKEKKEESKYTEEILSLKHCFDNIERVNSLLEKMSIKTIDWVESVKPDFIQNLEDSTWRFGDESDEDMAAELSNLRYLSVIWFALFNLKYKPEEITKIINEKIKDF